MSGGHGSLEAFPAMDVWDQVSLGIRNFLQCSEVVSHMKFLTFTNEVAVMKNQKETLWYFSLEDS